MPSRAIDETNDDLWIMAVSSSKGDLEDAEFILDAGGEVHVCGLLLLPRGETLGQPRSVMRDSSGNVVNNVGTSNVNMKLGGLGDEASCHVALQSGADRHDRGYFVHKKRKAK